MAAASDKIVSLRRLVLIAFTTIALCAAAPAALAGPSVESDSEVSGTQIHQEINFWNPEIHYWFNAQNPAGVPEFCVTLRLEKKRGGRWQGIGRGSRKGVTDCCASSNADCFPSETEGVWDLFLYPRGKLLRKVRKGRLRIHGFTDLGPSIKLRLDGPAA